MKKKYVTILLLLILFLTGCNDMMNTPTKRVEEYLGKYQTHDKEVLTQLNNVVTKDETLKTDEHRKKYTELMKKQYQNLSYKIKDETINGESATVTVEIEVFDYYSASYKATKYIGSHQEEFTKDNKTDEIKVMTYKLDQMMRTMDKVKYTVEFNLTKKENKWTMDNVSSATKEKIQGMYRV